MNISRKSVGHYALALLALLPLAGLAVTLRSCRGQRADLESPGEVLQALREAGLDYEGHLFGQGDPRIEPGYYLRRRGDARPWEELASQLHVAHPERWQRYVRIRWALAHLRPGERPGQIQLGRMLIAGDPAELQRIAEALR